MDKQTSTLKLLVRTSIGSLQFTTCLIHLEPQSAFAIEFSFAISVIINCFKINRFGVAMKFRCICFLSDIFCYICWNVTSIIAHKCKLFDNVILQTKNIAKNAKRENYCFNAFICIRTECIPYWRIMYSHNGVNDFFCKILETLETLSIPIKLHGTCSFFASSRHKNVLLCLSSTVDSVWAIECEGGMFCEQRG